MKTRLLLLLTSVGWLVATGCGTGTSQGDAPTARSASYVAKSDLLTPRDTPIPGLPIQGVSLVTGWNAVGFNVSSVSNLMFDGTDFPVSANVPAFASFSGGAYETRSFSRENLNSGAGTRRGFWILATAPTSMNYQGPAGTADGSVTLAPGWNQVSFPASGVLRGSALTAVRNGQQVPMDSVVVPLFYQLSGTGQSTPIALDSGNLTPGFAYWVFASTACTLNWGSGATASEPAASPLPQAVGSPAVPDPASTGIEPPGPPSDLPAGLTSFTTPIPEPPQAQQRPGIGEAVFNPDERVSKNTVTRDYPWRTQCKLYLRFPNGQTYIGSGTLISRRLIITAGHCVYDREKGGFANVTAAPGEYLQGAQVKQPYGLFPDENISVLRGWFDSKKSDDDMAIIACRPDSRGRYPGEYTGYLGYAVRNHNDLPGANSSYPGDKGGHEQFYSNGNMKQLSDTQSSYSFDTSGGSSGAGVYTVENGNFYVVAAHNSGGQSSNFASRINSSRFTWIQNFRRSYPDPTTSASPSPSPSPSPSIPTFMSPSPTPFATSTPFLTFPRLQIYQNSRFDSNFCFVNGTLLPAALGNTGSIRISCDNSNVAVCDPQGIQAISPGTANISLIVGNATGIGGTVTVLNSSVPLPQLLTAEIRTRADNQSVLIPIAYSSQGFGVTTNNTVVARVGSASGGTGIVGVSAGSTFFQLTGTNVNLTGNVTVFP